MTSRQRGLLFVALFLTVFWGSVMCGLALIVLHSG